MDGPTRSAVRDDPATRTHKLEPLRELPDSFPKLVLTLDHLGCGMTDNGIRVTNLADWLLDRKG